MSIGAVIDAAFDAVTDYRTGANANGDQIAMGHDSDFIISNGAITVGDVLVRVVPTQAQAPRVVRSGAAATGWTVHGVARTAAVAAGTVVEVVIKGFTLVNVGATAPVAGDIVIVSATAAQADVTIAATGITAATIGGTVLGEYLGAKGTVNGIPNLALIYYKQI